MSLTAAHAQVASQITPGSFAPPVQGGLGGGINIGSQPGLDTPAGAEKLFVKPRSVVIEGGLPKFAPITQEIRARLSGRKISGAEIFAAARELEAAYTQAGYLLVRVTLPRQKIVDGGTLRFDVINGFIERVETKNLPEPVRARITALLAPLAGNHWVTQRELERRILLAGDLPGVILYSTLAPGSTAGSTVLVVEARYQPINGIATVDNSLSRQLGHWQYGTGLDLNGVLGFGELFYLRATGDPNSGLNGFMSDNPRNRTLAAGVVVPLGIDGLSFNAEATLARTTPLADGGLVTQDHFERYSARLRYSWLRSRNADLSSQLVFDVQSEQENVYLATIGIPLFADRVRVLRLVNEDDYLTSWGAAVSGSLTPSFGIDAFGARSAINANASTTPLSAQYADASFVKLSAALNYRQTLDEHLVFSFSGLAQTSFGLALVRSEQIGIAGPAFLSAFDVGTLQGDSGYTGRAELNAPFTLSSFFSASLFESLGLSGVGVAASPYVFVAGGEVFLAHPTALQPGHISAGSFGGACISAGLRQALCRMAA